MWGDYHLRELVVYVGRAAAGGRYLAFHAPDVRFEGMGSTEATPVGARTSDQC
jgi:hypothetical protein